MEEIIVPFVVFALVFGGIVAGVDRYGAYQCDNYHEITGKETRYATLDTCYVKTEDGFQRWDEYKARAIASESLTR